VARKGQENLVPMNRRTPEEKQDIARKGGKKSGESRRRKKKTQELVKAVLAMEVVTSRKTKNALKKLGYDVDAEGAPSVELLMQIAIANQAMAGDLASARFLYDYAQIEDIKTAVERERIKAMRDARAKLDLTVNPSESESILREIREQMGAVAAKNGAPPDLQPGDHP